MDLVVTHQSYGLALHESYVLCFSKVNVIQFRNLILCQEHIIYVSDVVGIKYLLKEFRLIYDLWVGLHDA